MRGTIRARGKGTWQVQVYAGRGPDGREKRVARTVHGKKGDAETVLRNLIREVEAGQHQGDNLTVTELADQWHIARQADWSPRVRLEYPRQVAKWITPRIGARPIRKVTTRELDLFYSAMLNDGAGPRTVAAIHTILRSMFTQAVRWGLLAVNPAANARPPREQVKPIVPPDPAAVSKLIRSLDGDTMLAAFVRMAATTGCRRSELCALQWDDFDLDRGVLVVTRALDGTGGVKLTKTGQAKTMALDPATVAALTRWRGDLLKLSLRVRAGAPVWVFPASRDLSVCVNPSTMTHRWARLRDSHGLDGVRLHDLRHFMASRMLAQGVDVRTVANRLGHANPTTTLRVYAHLIPEADRAAADDLGRLLDNG
jgi:integrase